MRTPGEEPEDNRGRDRSETPPTPEDRDELLHIMARVARTPDSGSMYLSAIGFPDTALPTSAETPEVWWHLVFQQLDLGRVRNPYTGLIRAVRRALPENRALARMYQRYVVDPESVAQDEEDRRQATATCRVMVNANDEDERLDVQRRLLGLGLEPRHHWSTTYQVSFFVNSADPSAVRRMLDRTDLSWTVAEPGQGDYVIPVLGLQGPDGSRFIARDTPAQRTFRDVAEDMIATHYPGHTAGDTVPNTIIDQVGPDGQRQRTNPNSTLEEGGVQDGDQLRIGFEGRAGAVNPITRDDALHRVRSQILDHVRSHPGTTVSANSSTLPTAYDLEFDQDSFGPPPPGEPDPVLVKHHKLRIELGPEFPQTPPVVFWLSPIFHPNVFPMYDSEAARDRPELRGLVCLGQLDDAWYPGMDMREVCQMLVEIAGYRNYDLFQVTDDGGVPQLKGNFFDGRAAAWALHHQQAINDRGGVPIVRRTDIKPRVTRSVIDRVD